MYSVVFAISQRVLEYLIVLRDDILNSAEGAGFSESAKRARIGKAEGRCVKEQLTDYPSEYSCRHLLPNTDFTFHTVDQTS